MNETRNQYATNCEQKAKTPEIREILEGIRKELSGLEVTVEEFRSRVEPLRRSTPPAAAATTRMGRSIGTTLGNELFDIEERITRLRERLSDDLELMEL